MNNDNQSDPAGGQPQITPSLPTQESLNPNPAPVAQSSPAPAPQPQPVSAPSPAPVAEPSPSPTTSHNQVTPVEQSPAQPAQSMAPATENTTTEPTSVNTPSQPVISGNNEVKKGKSKLLFIILPLILVLLALAGGGYFYLKNRNKTSTTSSQASTSTPETNSTTKTLAFAVPLSISGWTNEIIDQQGINKFVSTDKTCQASFAQNKSSTTATALDANTTVTNYITLVEKGLGNAVTSTASADKVVKGLSGETKYTFSGKQIAYTGNDKVGYTNTIHAYVKGDYELIMIFACTTQKWASSQTLLDGLLQKVSISEL